MTNERVLLLSADPVAAWHQHWAGIPTAERGNARILVSAAAAARAWGVDDGFVTLDRVRSLAGELATPLARRRALLSAIAESGSFDARDAAGYATVAAGAVAELLRVADLEQPPTTLDARLQRWWRVAAHYRARLHAQGTLDPHEALRVFAQQTRPQEPLMVLGFLDLQPDELAAVDAWAGAGSVVVLPHDPPWTDANGAARAALRARGWREVHAEHAPPSPQVVAVAPATLDAEARTAVAEVKARLMAGAPPSSLLFATRQLGAYAESVKKAAAAAGLPLTVERRIPLAATPAGGAVGAWLEAVSASGSFEATLAWLAHPRVAAITADEIALVRRWRPDDANAWQRMGNAVAAALAWPARASAKAWRERLGAGWRGLGVMPRTDPAIPPLFADAQQAAHPADPWTDANLNEAWQEALESLGEQVMGGGMVVREAVLATLRDALRSERVPDVDGGPNAVRLVSLDAAAHERGAHIHLLGAVDGMLPPAISDEPILGLHERAQLRAEGVPLASAGDLARSEALRFWGAWRAGGSFWVGAPAQTGRDARLVSPYLQRLGIHPSAQLQEPHVASPQAFRARALRATDTVPDSVDAVLMHARRAYRQALQRETQPAWGPDDGFVGLGIDPDAFGWSATALTTLGTCRFKWWQQNVWRVVAPEEGATDWNPLLEGRLYHDTLDHALSAAEGLTGAEARAAAEAALNAAFARAERSVGVVDVVPHWRRRRDDHLEHLRSLVTSADFIPDGHTILRNEAIFSGVWHGWRVRGRVDRIDRTPHGLRVIDYKLGATRPPGARDAELKPTLDLQLPLYVDVAAPALQPDERVAGAVYISLRKMTELRAQPPDPSELDELFQRLRDSLHAGFFPVENDSEVVCRRCDLALTCRKGPHLQFKPRPYRVPMEPA